MAILALHSPAVTAQQAQQRPANDPAGAEVLFTDAKKAMAAGDYESACPKLAESYRLDPGTGTLTALAVCHETLGKTASAWAEFMQVVSDAAQAHRPDRERFAKQHIAVLEPKLSRLTILVDAATEALPGLEVRRDGIQLGRAAWGTAVPVDPGDHTVEAIADGKQRWSTSAKARETDSSTVTVPALEDVPVAPSPAPVMPSPTLANDDRSAATKASTAASPSEPAGDRQRTIGFVVGALGIAAAGLGTYFGVQALSKSSDANSLCGGSKCSNAQGVADEETAKGSAWGADIALGGAIVALGVGTVLLLTAPHRSSTSATVGFAPLLFSRVPGAAYSVRW
jgi:hypothetical protein